MRIQRLIAGVVSGALLGLVPVALAAAPAHAADVTTVTTIDASSKKIVFKSGSKPYIVASVKTSAGTSVYDGDVALQAKTAGSSWKTIRTADASSYVSFSDVVPKKNTDYRAVYQGGSDSYSGDTYVASQSGSMKIKVQRKFTFSGNDRTFKVKGRVTPKYGKKKIVIKVSKRQKRGFKKFRTIKTNKKGKYATKLPKRKGVWYYRFIVKGDKNYAGLKYTVTARVY
ncbi:hypothetical protein IEQ44_04820 [Nocardioides sp. Y6]|uniref:Uncharacterized protein n=1 Tax=Nocardioides malaquae TaxID=2773426 RepID=A0ABR9RQY7_9ACTN|nr:hypothetical protein [Nocardioides malaquae]MBE7323971.1 hypothetical protein [Nocardioides malaquae]